MLAAILRIKKAVVYGGLIVAAVSLISCATENRPVSVVSDPEGKRDTAIPWNEQQKWEQGAAMGSLANGSDRGSRN